MSIVRAAVWVVIFVVAAAIPALAQQPSPGTGAGVQAAAPGAAATPAPTPLWTAVTTGFGVQAYHGDAETIALNVTFDWLKQFQRAEVESTVNGQLQLSKGSSTTRTGYLNSSVRWVGAGSKAATLYPMTHVWLQHDLTTGIDGLAIVGGGVGAHLLNAPTVRLTLEGGVGETYENQTDVRRYLTFFLSPALRWKMNDRASWSTHAVAYVNGASAGDFRMHNEMDLNVQLTQTIGLQNQLLASYDNEPVVGKQNTNVQLSVNIAFSLTRGVPPPQ